MSPKQFTLTFLGDVMLGRLIDQLMPTHVHSPADAKSVVHLVNSRPQLRSYGPKTPWGNSISLLQASDLLLINLETAVTTHDVKWPEKVFNYRMHPSNLQILKEARVAYATLANNHTLDFSEMGLRQTVQNVKAAGIAYAGAGETAEEAGRPAVLTLPPPAAAANPNLTDEEKVMQHEIHVYAGSDHPADWISIPQFNLIDYTSQTRNRLKSILTNFRPSSLKIFSVHWGPNYAWHPSESIRGLAHFLIDECGVDVIHGHSSHHIQGVEIYRGRPIIYGCGDFVDDYALVPKYRNDLGAAWRLVVREEEVKKRLQPVKLEIFPSRIRSFQADLLHRSDPDHEWVRRKLIELCKDLGTSVEPELGEDGQICIQIA